MHFSKVLTDSRRNVPVPEWTLSSADLGGGPAPWSVVKRTLSGGRQAGVEVIGVDNGALRFTVVPTRGLNVWTAHAGELRLGWDSPVQEIVHPGFVNLTERGGLGWLNGFGEWICRCGLESFGPPCPDRGQTLTLHGRINYLPASRVEVVFEAEPVARLVVRGTVDESLMFGPQLRLDAEIATEIGQPALTLNDAVTNLGGGPQEFQLLYHLNFGSPLLGAGAEFIAPVKRVAPRDPRAAEGMAKWNVYAGPHAPGSNPCRRPNVSCEGDNCGVDLPRSRSERGGQDRRVAASRAADLPPGGHGVRQITRRHGGTRRPRREDRDHPQNTQMNAETEIKYPQITQITQIQGRWMPATRLWMPSFCVHLRVLGMILVFPAVVAVFRRGAV